jgi:hypothetical protein
MKGARRKNLNPINAAGLARWLVITVFLALTGLIYVYLSIQLHRLGDQQHHLEQELASLRNQNEVAGGQIAALTSRSALQRRLKEGYLKMTPIAESNIVRLSANTRTSEEGAIQPVANERSGR